MEIQRTPVEKHKQNLFKNEPYELDDDTIEIGQLFRTLWRYRKFITVTMVFLGLVFVVMGIIVYLASPSEDIARMGFRLEFEGAQKGRYPNGMKFSTNDIIHAPILLEVFERNNIEKYISFDDFKDSLYILQTNDSLVMLEEKYKAKLAEKGLSAVDRARIEKEFLELKESRSSPVYTLNFQFTEKIKKIPSSIIHKSLIDILNLWVDTSITGRGVLRYEIPVFTDGILDKQVIEHEEFIVVISILRTKIKQIIENINDLKKLPGAELVRSSTEQASLSELLLKLEDIIYFELQPLLGVIQVKGVANDLNYCIYYFEGQKFYSTMKLEEAKGRINSIIDSLRIYSKEPSTATNGRASFEDKNKGSQNTQSTQAQVVLSDTFIDRLTDIASQGKDLEFRQGLTRQLIDEGMEKVKMESEVKYYANLLASFKGFKNDVPAAEKEAAAAFIRNRVREITGKMDSILNQVNEIYSELSNKNLSPQTFTYSITTPLQFRIEASISKRKMLLSGLVCMLVSLLGVIFLCFIHNSFRMNVPKR